MHREEGHSLLRTSSAPPRLRQSTKEFRASSEVSFSRAGSLRSSSVEAGDRPKHRKIEKLPLTEILEIAQVSLALLAHRTLPSIVNPSWWEPD